MRHQRANQLARVIKELLAPQIIRIIGPDLLVAVTDVLVSDDLQQAKIWLRALQGTQGNVTKKVIDRLARYRKPLHLLLRRELKLKTIPRLVFLAEDNNVQRVEELIDEVS